MLVAIHDVSSCFLEELSQISNVLERLIGGRYSLAVVPAWNGMMQCMEDRDYRDWIGRYRHEYLLHGYFHRRQRKYPSPISWLAEGSDEFSGLDRSTIRERLSTGRLFVKSLTGIPPSGFVPPAWRNGRIRASDLKVTSMNFVSGLTSIRDVRGVSCPLATWSWDFGRFSRLGGCVGHLLGRTLSISPWAVPCVVIHPRDIERGWLNHAVDQIRALIGKGHDPVKFSDLIGDKIPRRI